MMKPRYHIFLAALVLTFLSADSQRISKTDKVIIDNLQTHIRSLSADTVGGRAMGSPGEKTTGDYVISELSKTGARPKGDNNGWLQKFTIDEGRQIGDNALFTIDEHPLVAGKEWFPLALSPVGEVKGSPAIALQESGVPWFQDIKEWLEPGEGAGSAENAGAGGGADNAHSDLIATIRAKAAAFQKKGATALILYNSAGRTPEKLLYDPKERPEPAAIPVVFITRDAKRKYLKDESASLDIRIRVDFAEKRRSGSNVVAFLDYGAATTVVIACRYNNSSGLAGMIELSRLLAESKLKRNNYLFIVLSGWGPEWPGAEFYCSHPVVEAGKLNYTLELNRLAIGQEAFHNVFIGGTATSAAWMDIENEPRLKKTLSFHNDSAASSPGIQSIFARQRIPSLVLSTGDGSDAVDSLGELRAVKFIFALIEAADAKGKLVFTP